MRINISITEADLAYIDLYCEKTGIPRSKFIIKSALIAIREMESGTEVEEILTRVRKVAKKEKVAKQEKLIEKAEKVAYEKPNKLCLHGLLPSLCKHRKCRRT